MKISAVILTKNEEKNIEGCLKSVSFCDEIIVVDDESTDKTLELIQKLKVKSQNYKSKVKIFQRKLNNDFASQRNFGLEKAINDWVLFVDADETISLKLRQQILSLVTLRVTEAYYIKRRDYFWGKELKYGETKKVRDQGIVRLVKKGSGKWMGTVHEVFYTASKIGNLDGYINHYPHQTLKEFINAVNYYSSIRAEELFNQEVRTNVFQIIFYPFLKFIYNYFILLGFFDGPTGFVYSFMMSFHSFLVRAKLYQLSHLSSRGPASRRGRSDLF